MSIPVVRLIGGPAGPPPRTNGTPSGYRNIRVLTSCSLHFRLVAYAGLSMCSLNEFVLKVLTLATPIDPATGLPVPASTPETAPGQRPRQDPQGDPGAPPGRDAAPTAEDLAPCQRPAYAPSGVPGEAIGLGASPSPRVPDQYPSRREPDPASAEGHAHV